MRLGKNEALRMNWRKRGKKRETECGEEEEMMNAEEEEETKFFFFLFCRPCVGKEEGWPSDDL